MVNDTIQQVSHLLSLLGLQRRARRLVLGHDQLCDIK